MFTQFLTLLDGQMAHNEVLLTVLGFPDKSFAPKPQTEPTDESVELQAQKFNRDMRTLFEILDKHRVTRNSIIVPVDLELGRKDKKSSEFMTNAITKLGRTCLRASEVFESADFMMKDKERRCYDAHTGHIGTRGFQVMHL